MIGLEPTFEEYLTNLVNVFREVRRVLRDDGTFWLNIGDAYSGGGRGKGSNLEGTKQDTNEGSKGNVPVGFAATGLQSKNLIMMPARVALALQADGWILRSEIIWAKPNPMPESVTDRPTSAHEKIYLFAKSKKYFYDAVAVRTEYSQSSIDRLSQKTFDNQTGGPKDPKTGNRSHRKVLENLKKRVPAGWASNAKYKGQDARHKQRENPTYKRDKQRGHSRRHAGFNEHWDEMTKEEQQVGGANLRNVWHIATRPYKQAHFATFPPALVEPCIKAGTSEMGCCSDCGAPLKRKIHRPKEPEGLRNNTSTKLAGKEGQKTPINSGQKLQDFYNENPITTIGWEPSCDCNAEIKPCVVLDPFMGSGTVASVASRLGRDSVGIEINPEYIDLIKNRLTQEVGVMFLNFEVR